MLLASPSRPLPFTPGQARSASQGSDIFADGKLLGTVPFQREGEVPLNAVIGSGNDGRLALDLSTLGLDSLITPNETFFIRTRYPDDPSVVAPRNIVVRGLVEAPLELPVDELASKAAPMGVHLLECAGNFQGAGFGLMSAAEWTGVPVTHVLKGAEILPRATRVLISGIDRFTGAGAGSLPATSWVFTFEEIEASGAFLATEMNGVPLTKDQGYPIRLVVPGWYACACIKWVDQIVLVDDTAPNTDLMSEYAGPTYQDAHGPLDYLFASSRGGGRFGPRLAKDFKPATVDLAAMPVRIEKWFVRGEIVYRVVGILWGGDRTIRKLSMRFHPELPYEPVQDFDHITNATWTLWSHVWRPPSAADYEIQLRIDEPGIMTRRLDDGFYVRTFAL